MIPKKGLKKISLSIQVDRIMDKLARPNQSRHSTKKKQNIKGAQSTGKIHSLRTLSTYKNSLLQIAKWVQLENGIERIKDITPKMVTAYLKFHSQMGYHQTTLNNAKISAELALSQIQNQTIKIDRVDGQPRSKKSRAYTKEQIDIIASKQLAHNSLATKIAYASGIRAHELLTLSKDIQTSSHRNWSSKRFLFRDGERYIVTGKGGLKREVMIPYELAKQLESTKLDTPRTIKDRGIKYTQHYDIGGGNAWSKSFSSISQNTFYWSNGGHGLRHKYAQERMAELQEHRFNYNDARDIIAQEMGHFRGSITETYFR